MSALEIYLLSTLVDISSAMQFLSIFTLTISMLAAIGWCLAYINIDDDCSSDASARKKLKTAKSYIFKSFITSITLLFLICFIPDRNTLISMYVIPNILKSDTLKQLPKEIHDWIELELAKKEK